MRLEWAQNATDHLFERYEGHTFNETDDDSRVLWSWHWCMAHKMEEGGGITFENGRSTFIIDSFRWDGSDVKVRVHRADKTSEESRWVELNASGFFLYMKPERERQKYIPKATAEEVLQEGE